MPGTMTRKLLGSTFLGFGRGLAPATPPAPAPVVPAPADAAAAAQAEAEQAALATAAAAEAAAKKAKKDDPDDDGDKDQDGDDEGDDETDEEEMRRGGGSIVCNARSRERARIAAIMASPAAAANPEFALKLALNQTMGRDAAIRLLSDAPQGAAPAPARPTLTQRMAPRAGVAAPPNPAPQTDAEKASAGWAAAFAKYNPKA